MKIIIKQKMTSRVSDMNVSNNPNEMIKRNVNPNCKQMTTLSKTEAGKWVTGYNLPYGVEQSEVLADKNHDLYDIIVEKVKIERALGVSLDDNSDNKFLIDTFITLCEVNNEEVILDTEKPLDTFYYRALPASGKVAPSYEDLSLAKYAGTTYYFSAPQRDQSQKKEITKLKDKIGGVIGNNEDNRMYLFAIAKLLNITTALNYSSDNVYNLISDKKDKIKTKLEAESFLKIVQTEKGKLLTDFIIENAIQYGLLIKNNVDNNWVTGTGQILGPSSKGIKEYLMEQKNQKLLEFIKSEIDKKYNI